MDFPSLFIGSSTEGLEFARAVRTGVSDSAEVTLWNEGVFALGHTFIEALVNAVPRFDFAVLVLTPDDMIRSRNTENLGPRDNVLFELGLFMGRLGRSRTFVLHQASNELKLPTDLLGLVTATYDWPRRDGNYRAAVGAACDRIRQAVRELGFADENAAKAIDVIRSRQDEEQPRAETWAGARAEALDVARQRLMGFEAEADRLVAECIYSITRALDAQRRLPENDLMDAILRAVCEKTRAAASREVTLRPSYLAFVPYDRADDALIKKALFTLEMPGGYSGYLVLRRGSQRVSREVVLPIARVPDQALPGAPEAVVKQGPVLVNIRSIQFRSAVSKRVQAEIREFYRHPYFDQVASVASFLVFDRDTFHGVINIESNEPNLLGDDEKTLQALDARLQPMIALFSVFR